jgi:copper transport protein
MALLLAFCLTLAFPGMSFAHAVLLRSDPANNAVLRVAPKQVHLWFSEAITQTLSTAQVVTPANQQVGQQHVSQPSGSTSQLVVTLPSPLAPGVYVVLWRSVSDDDGHLESGSFLFTVTRPNGTLPSTNTSTVRGNTGPGSSSTPSILDGPTLLSLFMVTLIELAVVGWVGAAFWGIFVLEPVVRERPRLRTLHQQVRGRLIQRVQLPALLVLLLAHGGVLVGQALALTQGSGAAALTPTILAKLVTSGHFGIFWLVRVLLLVLALQVLFARRREVRQGVSSSHRLLAWVNLLFGLAVMIALAMSSHAAAVASSKVTVAVLVDWFHLFAATLWVGGMLTIAFGYLPTLKQASVAERATSLLTVLPFYSPWAWVGVLLMAITGPVSATFQIASWEQLVTTAYGQVLLLKVVLVGVLLLLSAYHLLVLRPHVRKAAQKYEQVITREETTKIGAGPDPASRVLAGQVKQRELRLARQTHRLVRILRIEPMLGVAVLLCVGLMNVLGGTLVPASPVSSLPSATAPTQPRSVLLETFDHRFQVTFMMTPKKVGTNHFLVHLVDPHTGKGVSTVKVQLNTEMLERDMGVDVVPMTVDGTGQFGGSANLTVSGTWRMIVQIQTPDDPFHFHEAYTDVMISTS